MNALVKLEEIWTPSQDTPMSTITLDATDHSDNEIITRIANNEVEAYEKLFHTYYVQLCRFALKYIREEEICEEIVQETFISLWEKRRNLSIHSSMKSYMFTTVKNNALNYLNSQFARQNFQRDFFEKAELPVDNTQEGIVFDELQQLVQTAIGQASSEMPGDL